MKIRVFAYLIAFICIFFTGCRDNKDEEQRYTWSTDAPLTMPYRIRLQRFEKENLLRNPSFETGRTFRLDSLNTSFAIDGWQMIGQNIQWTDINNDSLYTKVDAYSGKRAVKIIRNRALETDEQGEGILSEFIRVIPGNYSLSFYTKMKDVYPAKARLGTKMTDGISINVLFFDRNKNQMRAATPYLQEDQEIDASFKALSFAHYSAVPDFGWGKVTGKSHSYPFPEGDIPSDAHYVRINISLKGTGTLWIDSITFKYTDLNFSVAERMLKYTDTAYHTPTALIPSPKRLIRMQSLLYFTKDMPTEQLPVIIVDSSLDENELKAVEMMREALQRKISESSKNPSSRIEVLESERDIGESKFVLSIGKTQLYKRYLKELPVKEIKDRFQGYYIYTPSEQENIVLIDANNSTGLYYAALTFIQMIDKKSPVLHNCRIIDYPDFPERYYTIENIHGTPVDVRKQVARAAQLRQYKINGAVMLDSESNELLKNYMLDQFRFISVKGYHPPENTSLTYTYPFIVDSDATTTESDLIIPSVFHNQMLDNSNYEEAFNNSGLRLSSFVYSGSSFFSINTDAADIQRFVSIVGDKPVFMDNSMRITEPWSRFGKSKVFYPGKLRLYNLFEPFMNEEIQEFFHYFDSTLFIVNQYALSEIEIIRLATAADFMWNAAHYSHDYSLWKVLVSRYGVENARDLIIYAEKYSTLLEIMQKLEMNIQSARNLKEGQQKIAEITKLLANISGRLGSQNELVKELQKINSEIRSKINQQSALVITFKK